MKGVVVVVAAAGLVATTVADAQEPTPAPAPTTVTAESPVVVPPAPAVSVPTVTEPPPAVPELVPSTPAAAPPAPEVPADAPAADPTAEAAPPRETDGPPAAPLVPAPARGTTSPSDAGAARAAQRLAAVTARNDAHAAKQRAREQVARERRRAERDAHATTTAPTQPASSTSGGGATLGAGSALPGLTIGAPIPSFLIERFRIPPFLLSIYQAAGVEYGVRWEILAAINEIETDYGRNLNVSSAGAQGWMQFMPATWAQYGTDANDDGRRDPYNPVDAIFATARYLKAAGYAQDVRGAIFAYNHADWYVDSVLQRATLVSLLPSELIGSLTGLTEGRFPVAARATYATRVTPTALRQKGRRRVLTSQGSTNRYQLDVHAEPGSRVVAVQDGKITRMGVSRGLGRYLQLRDVYGNTYTYANLGQVATTYLTPREGARADRDRPAGTPAPKAVQPAPAPAVARPKPAAPTPAWRPAPLPSWNGLLTAMAASVVPPAVPRTQAAPLGPPAPATARPVARVVAPEKSPSETVYTPYDRRLLGGLDREDVMTRPLRTGATVVGGTVLGRVGKGKYVRFRIRPAGEGTPLIDPTPILDGWRLLDSSAVYRGAGSSALRPAGSSVGRILLESKDALVRRVLASPDIELYECGRRDISAGLVDRRVLATLAFLAESGLEPTVSSLRCGHGLMTSSGNISEHSTGTAVDIAAINGVPIVGHQGPDSVTERTVRKLLTLQGTMKPHQIISLLTVPGTDNTLSMPDHADHIHVGWTARPGASSEGTGTLGGALRRTDWQRLSARLNVIGNPLVRLGSADAVLPAKDSADRGER